MDKELRNKFNKIMVDLIIFLKEKKIEWTGDTHKDGRINSSNWENDVIKLVEEFASERKDIKYDQSTIRSWRDFLFIIDKKYDLPVNIKLTSVNKKGISTNDNVGSKEGLIWTFSKVKPMNNRSWNSIKEVMNDPTICSNRDYYFLIIDKNNTDDIWYTSFKQINEIIVNSNNLPFQARWTDNRYPLVDQKDLQAFLKLFKAFYSGVSKLAEIKEAIPNPDDYK